MKKIHYTTRQQNINHHSDLGFIKYRHRNLGPTVYKNDFFPREWQKHIKLKTPDVKIINTEKENLEQIEKKEKI